MQTLKASASKEAEMFLENSKSIFLLGKTQILCLQHMLCCIGEQMRNHLGNTEEILTSNVSRTFPHLRTQTTYLADAEFASWRQQCFVSFLFAHPYNIVRSIDSKFFHSNVSLFALTFSFWQVDILSIQQWYCKRIRRFLGIKKSFTKASWDFYVSIEINISVIIFSCFEHFPE